MFRLIIGLVLIGKLCSAQDLSEEGVEFTEIPLMYVKNMPFYDECSDKEGVQRNNCTQRIIAIKIKENFSFPDSIKKKVNYTVYVKFIVGKTGVVREVNVLKGCEVDLLNIAAVDAVTNLPKFHPGTLLGKPVSIVYQVPIKIKN